MGWFWGKTHYFRKIHVGSWWFMDNPKTGAYVVDGVALSVESLQVMLEAGWVTTTSPSEPRSTVSAVFLRRKGWTLGNDQEGPMDGEMHLKDLKGPRKLRYCSHRFSHSTPLRTLAWIISNQSIWGLRLDIHFASLFASIFQMSYIRWILVMSVVFSREIPSKFASQELGSWNLVNGFIYHLWGVSGYIYNSLVFTAMISCDLCFSPYHLFN